MAYATASGNVHSMAFVTASGNVLATAFAIASENIHTSVPRVNGVMALVMVPGMVGSIAKLGLSIR